MSTTVDDNLYAIEDLTEHEIRRLKEDDERGKSDFRYHFLSPGPKEKSRSTNLRPVFDPKNTFGQTKPMVSANLHEGLSQLEPGTRRKLFPFIQPGVDVAVCLNDSDEEHYCHVCPRTDDMKKKKGELQRQADATDAHKDVMIAQKFRNWYSKIKRTLFHFFAAVRHLGAVPTGEEWKKGKVPVKKDPTKVTARNKHGLTVCNSEEAELWVDPCRIVKWKDWWIKPLFAVLNQRLMTPQKYSETIGKPCTQEEYLRNCPKKRPQGPFHPVEGYDIEVTVSGKQTAQEWKVTSDESEKLKNADAISMLVSYPNVMVDVTPVGEDKVMPFADWCQRNKKDVASPMAVSEWKHYRKMVLADAQATLLGLDREAKGEAVPEEVVDEDPVVASDGTAEEEPDLTSYDVEGEINIDLEV